MVRTIEQILGAQPLNQKLAAATPMYGAFQSKPDLTPFTTVPNQIPLTEQANPAPACGLDTTPTARGAAAHAERPRCRHPSRRSPPQWEAWRRQAGLQRQQRAVTDYANPEQMNRYTWYQAHDWAAPYPGDSKIYTPSQVPGGYIPSADGQ